MQILMMRLKVQKKGEENGGWMVACVVLEGALRAIFILNLINELNAKLLR